MKIKKLLVLFITLSMLVSVVACGTSEDDDVRGQINNGSSSQETESSENSEIENTEVDTSTEETESTETTENESPSLSLNNAKGSTYESNFIGIGWNLPEGWTFFDEEQLKQVNNITADLIDDEQIQAALESASLICDMYAMNSSTGDTINIQLEKLSGLATLYDASSYVDASISSLPSAMQSAGYTNVTIDKITITAAGKELPGLAISASYAGITIYEKLACIKVDNYMVCITTASATESTLDAIFANFYSLK